MSDKKEDGSTVAMGCMFIMAIMPFTILLRAFVMTQLWAWFISPLGVDNISLAHAYGLSIVIAMFTPTPSSNEEEGKGMAEIASKFFFTGFGVPLAMWAMGWLCSSFM